MNLSPVHKENIQWKGVVCIQRGWKEGVARVFSARTQIKGLRSIVTEVEEPIVRKYFGDTDKEFVCAYAELRDGYLQLMDKASPRELYSLTEQIN